MMLRRPGLAIIALCLSASLAAAETASTPKIVDAPDEPSRTGNNQMQRCLFDPDSCPPGAKPGARPPAPTRSGSDGEELTPAEKLELFKQRFKCGEGGSGICVEDIN